MTRGRLACQSHSLFANTARGRRWSSCTASSAHRRTGIRWRKGFRSVTASSPATCATMARLLVGQHEFSEMAGDLETLVEEHGLAPVTVLGHSVGSRRQCGGVAACRPHRGVDRHRHRPWSSIKSLSSITSRRCKRRSDGARRKTEIDAALASAVPDAATRLFLMQNLEEPATKLQVADQPRCDRREHG